MYQLSTGGHLQGGSQAKLRAREGFPVSPGTDDRPFQPRLRNSQPHAPADFENDLAIAPRAGDSGGMLDPASG